MRNTAPADLARVFVAIELPPPVIAALETVQDALAASQLPLRLTGAAGIHLTLAFLGEIPVARVAVVNAAVVASAAAVAPFDLRAEGIGMFPNARVPRVIWAGVEGTAEAMAGLTAVREGIAAQLAAAGFTIDRRFDPHLTLARVRDGATGAERAAIGAAVQALPRPAPAPFAVTQISVMRSVLQRGGAVYSALAQVPLRADSA